MSNEQCCTLLIALLNTLLLAQHASRDYNSLTEWMHMHTRRLNVQLFQLFCGLAAIQFHSQLRWFYIGVIISFGVGQCHIQLLLLPIAAKLFHCTIVVVYWIHPVQYQAKALEIICNSSNLLRCHFNWRLDVQPTEPPVVWIFTYQREKTVKNIYSAY